MNKHYTGKATVKSDSTWRYKGLTLDIVELYMTYNNYPEVYPIGTRVFKLSLKGTQWFDEQEYTFIPETDLENVEAEEDITKRLYSHEAVSELLKQNQETIQELVKALEELMRFKDSIKYAMEGALATPANFMKALDNLDEALEKAKL